MREQFRLGSSGLEGFLDRWFGVPHPLGQSHTSSVDHGGRELPEPLRSWYAVTAGRRWPTHVPFNVLAPDEIHTTDGKGVFVREDQEVYEWAFDTATAADDPPVYERAVADGEPWHPSEVTLSAFLVTLTVATAVVTAEHGISARELTRATLEQILQPLTPLPAPGPTINAQLYADDEAHVLAFTGPDLPGDQTPDDRTTWWIMLAALTPAGLEHGR